MGLKIGGNDVFKRSYTSEFMRQAAQHGIAIRYDEDLAGIDLGLQMTSPTLNGESVDNVRVWFQLKGIKRTTLSLQQFESAEAISLSLEIEHLRHWYRSAEPVYLVVYIEAAGVFLAQDVRALVDAEWGDSLLNLKTFRRGQRKTTVHINKKAVIDEMFWRSLRSHRSMRIDIRSFRGTPLPHTRDPRTETMLKMAPTLFTELVDTLLGAHGYKVEGSLDAEAMCLDWRSGGDIISLTYGRLFETYQGSLRITSEIIGDSDGFRIDGQNHSAQGLCATLVHSHVVSRPRIESIHHTATKLRERGIRQLLVFVNHYFFGIPGEKAYCCLGEYLQGTGPAGVTCIPQHLEDLSRNVLLSTDVYLHFQGRVEWFSDYVQEQLRRGTWRIMTTL